MSDLIPNGRLTRDKWIAPTRREIGYGLQFLAIGLATGYGWGAATSGHPPKEFWFSVAIAGLILTGGRLIRS